MKMHRVTQAGLLAAAILTAFPIFGQAQEAQRGWGPGTWMGPGMMGGRGFGMLCSPQAAGLAEWRPRRIERSLKATDEQKKKLDDLRAASEKAAETIKGACPRDLPRTSAERLALMETRLEVMLQALKTVRPAFNAFYDSLSSEQKAKLDNVGPRRWGWRFWRRDDR